MTIPSSVDFSALKFFAHFSASHLIFILLQNLTAAVILANLRHVT